MMIPFEQMLHKVTSSAYHNKMMRFVKPLENHFGINHFWYYRITYSGHYSYVGTHTLWDEFCFANDSYREFPHLRHPDSLVKGISLMKNSSNLPYQEILNSVAGQFGINFHIHLLKNIPEGVEGYGFATHHKLGLKDEYLLNHLPLLNQFIKQFRIENQNIFNIIYENPVDLASLMGPVFHQKDRSLNLPNKRDAFLREIGYKEVLSLSPQEMKVFQALANGFPANYIANELSLSTRTVEHYIVSIKQKLFIDSKVELIEKAKEFVGIYQPHVDF
jgi:DNA-binding CsgD family transcriptional regulator